MWCIVANVVEERAFGPGGLERRRGLKLFAPGAKVHVVDGFGGMGYETLTVVGQVRRSPRFSVVHVRLMHLTTWRVRMVYSPAVLRQVTMVRGETLGGFGLGHVPDPTAESYRDDLQRVADIFSRRAETERAHA